jgi:hypothetical protein
MIKKITVGWGGWNKTHLPTRKEGVRVPGQWWKGHKLSSQSGFVCYISWHYPYLHNACDWVLALPLMGCVVWSKLFNLSGPCFPSSVGICEDQELIFIKCLNSSKYYRSEVINERLEINARGRQDQTWVSDAKFGVRPPVPSMRVPLHSFSIAISCTLFSCNYLLDTFLSLKTC